jgi:hypothetical protein
MKKKDAYLLWDVNKDNKICNFLVTKDVYFYDKFRFKGGKCNIDLWGNTTLLAQYIQLSMDYGFADRTIAWQVFDHLRKINEWKKELDETEKILRTYWL